MATPGDLRAYDVISGKEVWRFHTIPHPGEFGYDTWPKDAYKYVGGTNTWGEITVDAAARHRLLPDRLADLRLLRRRSARREPLRHVAPRARRAHGQTPLALPDGAPRPLGLRQLRRAAADDDSPQRQDDRRRRAGRQDRLPLRLRSRDGRADLADRGTAGAEERHARRAGVADAAVPDRAAAVRVADADGGRRQPVRADGRGTGRLEASGSRTRATRGSSRRRRSIDTVAIPGANGGANWGNTAAHPTNGTVYVQSINVPSIYRLSLEAPGRAGGPGRGGAPAAVVAQGQTLYAQRCQTCHGPDLRGHRHSAVARRRDRRASSPTRCGKSSPAAGRRCRRSGTSATADMDALVAFLASSNGPPAAARAAPPRLARRPCRCVGRRARCAASGGRGGGGMVGLPYPAGLAAFRPCATTRATA